MDPLLSKLEALPVELQLAILQHIPPRQDSTLPFASLLSISRSSRTLHTLVSPLLYAEVRLSSTQQVQRLLDDSAPHLEQYVRRLTLRRSNLNSTVWDLQTLSRLLGALSELTDLSLDGVVDQRTLRRLLHDLPTKDRFERFDLTCAQPATNRADYPHSAVAAAAVPGDDDPFLSLSHASEPSWVEALAGFPALVHLRLVNADLVVAPSPSASASLFPDGSAGSSISVSLLSSLRSVELEGVSLTDAVLRTLLTGGKVEEVALRRCTGFSRTGLVEAIKSNGGRLRRLELVDNGGVATTPSLLPSPLSSPSRSPTLLSASTRTLPSLSATSPTLVGILDSVLPFLPHLTHLSTSGALFSPTLLHQLHTLTAHLLHLSISAQPHITPAALLPLLHQSPPDEKSAYLPSLRRLELHGSTSPSPSYSCTLSSWSTTSLSTGASNDCSILDLCTTARAQDVHLVGEVFEQVQERLDWAEREAQKLASGMERLNVQEEEGGKGVRRRKRPGVAVRG